MPSILNTAHGRSYATYAIKMVRMHYRDRNVHYFILYKVLFLFFMSPFKTNICVSQTDVIGAYTLSTDYETVARNAAIYNFPGLVVSANLIVRYF